MNTDTSKIFDENNELTDVFPQIVDEVLASVHGEDFFDIDQEYIIPEDDKKSEEKIKNTYDEVARKRKVTFKDFIPVLFFVLIFAILTLAGYYFLNNFDFTSILK